MLLYLEIVKELRVYQRFSWGHSWCSIVDALRDVCNWCTS